MISDNIKNLRVGKGLTQKELADKLYVTSQAVSRWENGEVEPSVDTISSMARIFNVTTDEIINGPDGKPKPEVITEIKERVVVEQGKPVLTICENCKRPIYNSEEIVTQTRNNGRNPSTNHFICIDCDKKNKEQNRQNIIANSVNRRTKSFIWGTVAAVVALGVWIYYMTTLEKPDTTDTLLAFVLPILTFTFTACCFLNNNFVGNMFLSIASWGLVKFPGIIFPLSLDGVIWLIGVKIMFWVIGFILGFIFAAVALLVCMPLSAIAYPFALLRNYRNPEIVNED